MGRFFFDEQETVRSINDLIEIFQPYELDDNPDLSDIKLPEQILGIDVHYMIYQLCGGDITKKSYVENNCDIIDFYEWHLLKKYEVYCETEAMKRKQGKGTKKINNFKGFD